MGARPDDRSGTVTNWASWGDFWQMGGYGLYVWGSYGVTLLALAAEAVGVRQRLHRARKAAP